MFGVKSANVLRAWLREQMCTSNLHPAKVGRFIINIMAPTQSAKE
jgi:hypothetical protein